MEQLNCRSRTRSHPMHGKILITGSSGLVGAATRPALRALGYKVVGCDLLGHGSDLGDVRDAEYIESRMADCDGVLHLAAVSRVAWAEADPALCEGTNVGGIRNILAAARRREKPPWVLFASSREVYGHVAELPATEDTPLRPINVYGRSKVAGEDMIREAAAEGIRAATVRLSNVYGAADDHVDRVIPAFLRAAMAGGELRVEGGGNTFDFVHLSDVARGLCALINRMSGTGPLPPPVHLVTGVPTSLGQLARLAVDLGSDDAECTEYPARDFDVSVFHGDPARAADELDWKARVPLREGMKMLRDALAGAQTRTAYGSPR